MILPMSQSFISSLLWWNDTQHVKNKQKEGKKEDLLWCKSGDEVDVA